MSVVNDEQETPAALPEIQIDPTTPELDIPEARDGFYTYAEEKTQQQVDEKYWAHRRGSETASEGTAASFVGNFKLSQLHSTAPPGEVPTGGDPFVEEEDEKRMKEEVFVPETTLTSELMQLFQSFQRCLELRDKYTSKSRQRLGDDPRHYDGAFPGLDDKSAGVSGVRPDANLTANVPPKPRPDKWKIYPKPPPPHWHWTDTSVVSTGLDGFANGSGFRIEECPIPGAHPYSFEIDDKGVFQVYDNDESEATNDERTPVYDIPSIREYFVDLDYVLGVISHGPTKSFAYRRLKYLASKFTMYSLLNEFQELSDMKVSSSSSVQSSRTLRFHLTRYGSDFYNVRKVDTHVHHSSSMNQKHLLRFIKSKMKRSPQDVVIFRDGKALTLQEVFQSLKLTAYDLSIDTLDMHAHSDSFHRFDKFNLKRTTISRGRYLAELTKGTSQSKPIDFIPAEERIEIMTDLEQSKYQNVEWRVSIYGRSPSEWDNLAKWIVNNKLYSHNVRWLIQVPRLYDIYKANGSIQTFQDIILNVFQPLFEVTQDPRKHPELHVFLQRVIGFDTVDDESKVERRIYKKYPYPKLWDTKDSPPYSYWIYYMFANMASLNRWRQERGFNTFVLRPHAGEAGDTDHLTSAFLTSHSISHGILLRKVPALQYLFYLKQIGIAMSPLSNNALFLAYERNPLPDFFKTGLNVSLSTDDPLQFHFTKEPLLEEYSVAAHIYKFPQSSLAELARNSVIQSGFEMEIKRHWLGHQWYLPGAAGNDIHKTNVPNIRLAYRHQTLLEELNMINMIGSGSGSGSVSAVAGTGMVQPTPDAVAARAMGAGLAIAPRSGKHTVC
ncbi:A-deaminase domain-containing protein [Mycena indigotica]|uniref:AMP deaminase n=1 Tax=Mycena indigotica TaxID=2126181 RepID=A0A8H6W485_9AGAR|nr:A-deaminase domain-containing protein [Mycena indigotica]KAF7298704.1 A-deaminase domain-containing protein [Mycena indigotica]